MLIGHDRKYQIEAHIHADLPDMPISRSAAIGCATAALAVMAFTLVMLYLALGAR